MKLKLTNRERKLLAILGVCILAAALYYAVIKPQLDTVSRLEKLAKGYSITIEAMKVKASPDNPKYKEYDELYNKTQALLKPFYPSIMQEKIILMLENKLNESGLKEREITFTEPSSADLQKQNADKPTMEDELEKLAEQIRGVGNNNSNNMPSTTAAEKNPLFLEKMAVTINMEGSYSQIYSFIKAVEQENRSIACSNLSIKSNDKGLLSGVITMNIYSIPKPFDQDEEYLNWDINGSYGKANPFENVQTAPLVKP